MPTPITDNTEENSYLQFIRQINDLGSKFHKSADGNRIELVPVTKPLNPDDITRQLKILKDEEIHLDIFSTAKEADAFASGLSAAQLGDDRLSISNPINLNKPRKRAAFAILWRVYDGVEDCQFEDHR